MKHLSLVLAVSTALSIPLAARPVVQSPKQTVSQAAVLGQWRGVMQATPAVDLTIKQNAGAVAGTIVFYRIDADSDGNPKVVGQDEMPLQDPIWKSGVLSFGVKRGEATVHFTMQPSGPASAELRRVGAPADEPPLPLTRTSKAAR
jgi:hypothetical protein